MGYKRIKDCSIAELQSYYSKKHDVLCPEIRIFLYYASFRDLQGNEQECLMLDELIEVE